MRTITKIFGLLSLFITTACQVPFDVAIEGVVGELKTTGMKGFKSVEVFDSVQKKTVTLTDGKYRFYFKKGYLKPHLIEIYSEKGVKPLAVITLDQVSFGADGVIYGESLKTGQMLSFASGRKRRFLSKTYKALVDDSCTIQMCKENVVTKDVDYDCSYDTTVDGKTVRVQKTCSRVETTTEWESCPGERQALERTSQFVDDYEITFYAGKLDPVGSFYQTSKVKSSTSTIHATACEKI
jgi:hypothetical protein